MPRLSGRGNEARADRLITKDCPASSSRPRARCSTRSSPACRRSRPGTARSSRLRPKAANCRPLADELILIPTATRPCCRLWFDPVQLLSYYIAVERGCDVDKPAIWRSRSRWNEPRPAMRTCVCQPNPRRSSLVAALSGCATVMQDAGLGPAKDANGDATATGAARPIAAPMRGRGRKSAALEKAIAGKTDELAAAYAERAEAFAQKPDPRRRSPTWITSSSSNPAAASPRSSRGNQGEQNDFAAASRTSPGPSRPIAAADGSNTPACRPCTTCWENSSRYAAQ